jgi:hypothetical protein
MSEFNQGGVPDDNPDRRNSPLQRELNGHAVELLSHILPKWLHQSYAMQQKADKDELLKKLEIVLYKKTNFKPDEIPRLRVKLVPHDQTEPIEYLDKGQLVDITVIVPLTFMRDLEELDGLELAMLHVKISTLKGTRIRKLALAPTSLMPYNNFDNLVIETVKDHQGEVWIDSIEEITDDEFDPGTFESGHNIGAPSKTALGGFRRIIDKYKNPSVGRQLQEIKLIKSLLDSDEYLRVGTQ